MAAKGRSMKRAILTTALLLALPVGVAAQSAPDLEVAFAEVDDSTPVEGGRFKLWVTPERPDRDGTLGRTHDFHPRPGRGGERIGAGGRRRLHRRGPAL